MPPKRKSSEAAGSAAKKAKSEEKGVPSTATVAAASKGTFSLAEHLKDSTWRDGLSLEMAKPYFKEIEAFLDKEYSSGAQIFPPRELIFNAFNLTPLDQVKVVILGQDPYHDDGQAHGLSFSVMRGVKPPPSLKNIYTELSADIEGFSPPDHGNLESWAEQGVLLLNATLTVVAHKPNSHSKIGWQTFTDSVIRLINGSRLNVVFLLWGGFAHKKEKLIDQSRHHIIKTAHPSPLSVTKFRGCRCFSAVNKALLAYKKPPISWLLPH